MLPKTHPLIEAVTESLSDNVERRMAARAVLEERLDPEHPAVADTVARLEAAGWRKFRVFRNAVPWILAALALSVVIALNAPTMRFMGMVYNYDIFEPWEKPALPAGLGEEQSLLLGDPRMDDLEQKGRLHRLVPENPAYFAEYAQAHLAEMGRLPPDFLETSARIAPDNAYFVYFAAGQAGKESVTKKTRTAPPPRIIDGVRLSALPREMEYEIADETAFEEALVLVAKGVELASFESYTNRMIAARVRLLPTETLAEFSISLMSAYGTSAAGIIQLRYVADLLDARAEQLSKSGRKDEFLALAAQRDSFIAQLGRNPDMSLIGELVHSVIAAGTATNFAAAADRLGLSEMAEGYRRQSDAFRKDKDMRDIRGHNEGDSFPEEKASALTRLTLPMIGRQVNDPPPLTDADFEPMRMAEHELLGGFGMLSVALVITLAAFLVFLFRFVAPPMIRLPAKRMAGALGIADWIWVGALGVALPIGLFLAITRHTPLGGRDYGAMHFLLAFPGVHLVALLLGLLVAPALIVRWRLGKRLAPFGIWDRFTIPVFFLSLSLLLLWSLAALPGLTRFGMDTIVLMALAAPQAACLGLLFANALRSLLGKSAARLAQCATAVAVLPAYPVAIIALCALTPIYSLGEKSWLAKETLLRIDPSAPDLGAYEFKVAAQKRKEINAITGVD